MYLLNIHLYAVAAPAPGPLPSQSLTRLLKRTVKFVRRSSWTR